MSHTDAAHTAHTVIASLSEKSHDNESNTASGGVEEVEGRASLKASEVISSDLNEVLSSKKPEQQLRGTARAEKASSLPQNGIDLQSRGRTSFMSSVSSSEEQSAVLEQSNPDAIMARPLAPSQEDKDYKGATVASSSLSTSSPTRNSAKSVLETQSQPVIDLAKSNSQWGVGETYPSNDTQSRSQSCDRDDGSRSEIQSIMDQFDKAEDDPDNEAATSKTQDVSGLNPHCQFPHPPRRSSLEPITSRTSNVSLFHPNSSSSRGSDTTHSINHVDGSARHPDPAQSKQLAFNAPIALSSSQASVSLQKALPPQPDPEPDLPFDFHRFLEQLRHRTADPVAKFLRSFLSEFGKKQWMVHEQVKIISDFLAFIANKMAQCEVWRGVSDAEFDNAKEGMEKLVMNRLYSQTFSPAIPHAPSTQESRGKRKNSDKILGSTRKGQHQEDIERDDILAQKVRIYGWVEEAHLDIPPLGESGHRFLLLAQQGILGLNALLFVVYDAYVPTELLKIKTYRAPRDKVICVLNCCKVIFGIFLE